jgi:guanylate cyclase soluble subunit beta
MAATKEQERQDLQERQVYDDDFTLRLLHAASKLCEVSEIELLEGFGEQFFIWCREFGYDRTLQALGATVRDFISNLDALHDHLATNMFPEMRAPSFRCTDGSNGEILLHYYSSRVGLQHIVIGIIKTVCRQLHHTEVKMEIVQERSAKHDHVVFSIRELGAASADMHPDIIRRMQSFKPDLSYIDRLSWSPVPAIEFCQIFPFHIMFDEQQRICQLGTSLFRVITSHNIDVQHARLDDIFEVVRPQGMSFSFKDIQSHINMVFVLGTKDTPATEGLRLKGQMVWLNGAIDRSSSGKMLFLCSPRVGDLSELAGRRLYLSDLPLHDATRDLMLLDDTRTNQHGQIVKLEDMNTKLNVAHQELAVAHKDLAKEKDLTDKLLYSMFPVHVATQLKQDEEVAAETFPSVTILFSDIVGFTAICGKCHPSQIVRMLDSLYKEFDAVTRENKLYKVETIGDAYMVVGGLTNRSDCHEEMVCNQALDMMDVVEKVKNPINPADHIHIRVGIHSGEVMAGVVGRLMPRYCLFGDTVNIASRTESTGEADKIQVTQATYKGLESKPHYVFEDPHVVGMKNVRQPMVCYFLKENKKRGNRHHELLIRRTSVFLLSVSNPQPTEDEQQPRKKVSQSSLREPITEDDSMTLNHAKQSKEAPAEYYKEESDGDETDVEKIGGEEIGGEETDEGNTMRKEDIDYQTGSETTEEVKHASYSLGSPTVKYESPMVWLMIPFLFAAVAVACFYWLF